MAKSNLAAIAILTAALGTLEAAAKADSAVDLVRQVQDQSVSPEETASMTMRLIDPDGRIRERKANYYQRQTEPGAPTSARLIRFSAPAEMDGSGVLTIEKAGGTDDQWLYLPAYHASRKIPSASRSDRYMGTDFSYEDVSADKIDTFQYAFVGTATIDGRSYREIEQKPAGPRTPSGYTRKLLFVDQERLLICRIDFFDRSDVLVKRLEGSDAARIGSVWRWKRMAMTDLRAKHRTVIDYTNRSIGTGAPANLFTVRYLERSR